MFEFLIEKAFEIVVMERLNDETWKDDWNVRDFKEDCLAEAGRRVKSYMDNMPD